MIPTCLGDSLILLFLHIPKYEMSIVPYYSDKNNKIVYHDLTNQIVVVHNPQENSFNLYNDRLDYYPQPHGHASTTTEQETEIFCPNCGVDLLDFLALGSRPKFRRHSPANNRLGSDSHRSERSAVGLSEQAIARWKSRSSLPPAFGLPPVEFMHRDYFKLLANVTETSAALQAPGEEATTKFPNDSFNQGYFARFFKKIPPGVLGSGASAQVFKVAHVLKNIQLGVFAVKRINVGSHSQYLDHVLNEVLILYELSVRGANEHNLIRYNHVWMETGDLSDLSTILMGDEGAPAQNEKAIVPYVYILQQYCEGGHLEHVLITNFQREVTMLQKEKLEAERTRRRSLKLHGPPVAGPQVGKLWLLELEIWKFFHDIVNGVLYLHAHGILHRDLKPSNCLLEYEYDASLVPKDIKIDSLADLDIILSKLPRVLVSDFGEGKFIDKQSHQVLSLFEERRGNTGTVEFTDPKLWVYTQYEKAGKGKRRFAHNFTYDCDIYSLGMILCYLCVGILPFAEILTNTNDPDAVRRDISNWHDNLTLQRFHEWFSRRYKLLNDTSNEVMRDFEDLIYSMIKGESNSSKPSADNILKYLLLMKESIFSPVRRNNFEELISSPIISDHGCSTPSEPGEDDDDTRETLDLFKEEVLKEPLVVTRIEYERYSFVAVCLACLALLEMIDVMRLKKYVAFVKLCNVLCLVSGLQLPFYRFHLAAIGIISTMMISYINYQYLETQGLF